MARRIMRNSRKCWGTKAVLLRVAAILVLSLPAPAKQREAPPLTASQFAALIERFSEPGGYFWNDNFVSNEASYLHPLRKMQELGIGGGIYLGVGPNQNLTYIAKLHPRYAFIVDIRRQNMLEHLLFKALFHYARDRREYLSLLLSRPVTHGNLKGDGYTVEDLVHYFRDAPPDAEMLRLTFTRVQYFLSHACRVELSDADWKSMGKVLRAFYYRGLSIKYDYIPVPTYGEFLTERDLEGRMGNFLNSTTDFRYLKRLQEENRIVPITGDFAGPHALKEIGKYLKERGEKVTVFYTSNVEQYLMRNMTWPRFLQNVRELPLDDHAVFIRAYWSSYYTHPEGVAGYRFTQILQWIKPFLKDWDPTANYSYWDVVTTNTIKLH